MPIKDIAVGAGAAKLGDQVGETSRLQGGDRLFLGIGVQVADDEHVGVTTLVDDGGDKTQQGVGLVDTLGVVAALAIQLIRVGAGGVGAALGLEVVDHDRKATTIGGFKELRNRRAIVDRRVVDHG